MSELFNLHIVTIYGNYVAAGPRSVIDQLLHQIDDCVLNGVALVIQNLVTIYNPMDIRGYWVGRVPKKEDYSEYYELQKQWYRAQLKKFEDPTDEADWWKEDGGE